MKGLNKILLVAAIAAAPLAANAQLKPLSNNAMGNLTGQAGITIELQTKVDIGSVVYTDTANADGTDGGSLVLKGIHIGGGSVTTDTTTGNVNGVSGNFDNVLATIDLNTNGNAVIAVHSTDGLPIDYAVGIEQVNLRNAAGTDGAILASNIGIAGTLAALNITVANAGTTVGATTYTTDTLIATVAFSVDNMNLDLPFLAVGVRNLSVHGVGFNAAPGAANNYAQAQLTLSAGASGITGTPNGTGGVTPASGPTSALVVNVANFAADVNVGSLLIGGTSIGSLAINNLQISNTKMVVYGH